MVLSSTHRTDSTARIHPVIAETAPVAEDLWVKPLGLSHKRTCSAKCGFAIACRPSVCPSVTLVDCDHIGWKSWNLIAQYINNPTSSLFAAKR